MRFESDVRGIVAGFHQYILMIETFVDLFYLATNLSESKFVATV
jgi:hypothetical protein